MTFGLREHAIRAIVLDIEGTTTPIAFVYEVLFPFARTHLRQYLHDRGESEEVREVVRRLRVEWLEDVARGEAPPEWNAATVPAEAGTHEEPETHIVVGSAFRRICEGPAEAGPHVNSEDVASYVEWLMDRDRKSPGLKLLQGQIWERGYREQILHGEVFPDVPAALERWRDEGITTAIYSSGSVLAQRQIFSTTLYGDLTPLIGGFFDTGVGAKMSPDSYRRIADALGCPIERMLFVSDVTTELDAARSAGCHVLLCVRPGNRPPEATDTSDVVHGFEEIT